MSALRRGAGPWIACVVVLLGGAITAGAPYGGGSGAEDDPYLIYTAEQLNAIGAHPTDWGCYFKLMADVDLSAYAEDEFNIIGIDLDRSFSGVFDGNGHTISNFTYVTTGRDNVGLFGYVQDKGPETADVGCYYAPSESTGIRNLGLVDARVESSDGSKVGGLVGSCFGGTITNCYVRGVTVSGGSRIGGLIGEHPDGIARNCYASSVVTASGDAAGGLVGLSRASIANCYATGNVSGSARIGGLAGQSYVVECCYSTAAVSGHSETGGLIGFGGNRATRSFWDIEASGQATSAAGQGLTTAEMQDPNTFVAAGWDFFGPADGPDDIWTVDAETGHPMLWWELPEEAQPELPVFSGGTGTVEDPYRIASAEELNQIRHNPRLMAAHFRLVSDIDLAGIEFGTIGSTAFPFAGDFDGHDKAISNYTLTRSASSNVGFFSYVNGAEATIHNLTLIDPNVAGGTQIGSLVGHLVDGTVDNCHVRGGRVDGGRQAGGLVGLNDGTIRDCSVDTTVSAWINGGGLVGASRNTIANCHAAGTVTGGRYCVGGLVGAATGLIRNCSTACAVTGRGSAGGLAGLTHDAFVANCYTLGDGVSGESAVGGLVGDAFYSTITHCYASCPVAGEVPSGGLMGRATIALVDSSFWNLQTSGQATSAAGAGKTAAEMADPNTFVEAGWDLFGPSDGPSDIWTLVPGSDHPVLWWQVPAETWPPLPAFAGGMGTPEDPYLIESAAQLSGIGQNPGLMESCFQLTGDIDLNGTAFVPIGGLGAPFAAVFDGNECAIANLVLIASAAGPTGVFGLIDGRSAQVRNLTLSAPYISADEEGEVVRVGALAGYLKQGTLLDCHVEGGSITGGWGVGGLAGEVARGTVHNCHTTTAVTATSRAGGLLGLCCYGAVTECSAAGAVTGRSYSLGGLVGETTYAIMRDCHAGGSVTGGWGGTGGLVGDADHSAIARCGATGNVSATDYTGGLVGFGRGPLADSYATGTVTGRDLVGGLMGGNYGIVTDCHAAGAVTGNSSVGGLIGSADGIVTACYASGTVAGDASVGGLAGISDGTIRNCYATGTVLGQENVGGLVGDNGYGKSPGFIVNCYAAGPVSGQTQAGGLVGLYIAGSVTDSFWDREVSGLTTSAAGAGKTTAEMQQAGTFLEAGWDFSAENENGTADLWWILEGQDYPRLWWEADPNRVM